MVKFIKANTINNTIINNCNKLYFMPLFNSKVKLDTPVLQHITPIKILRNNCNQVEIFFYNENNEIVKRPLKIKWLMGMKRIHITYNNVKYILLSNVTEMK